MSAEKFDLEKVYDDEIAPLMTKIIDICEEHNMPFVADFFFRSDGEGDNEHCSSASIPKERTDDIMEAAWKAIKPRSSLPMLKLTTRNKDGEVTNITMIAG